MKRDDTARKIADSESDAAPRPLGLGWSLTVDRGPGGVTISLLHPRRDPFCVEIELTAAGPILRARAAAVEVHAEEDVIARCRRFEIDALECVSIRAREIEQTAHDTARTTAANIELGATTGDIRLRANDDVQLIGEQVLLNCDRSPPLPGWLPLPQTAPEKAEAILPRQDNFGEADLAGAPGAPRSNR